MNLILIIVIIILLVIIYKQNEKIKILYNNWETAKKVISEYDPTFKAYLEKGKTNNE